MVKMVYLVLLKIAAAGQTGIETRPNAALEQAGRRLHKKERVAPLFSTLEIIQGRTEPYP